MKCISCSQPLPKSISRRRVGGAASSHLLPTIKNCMHAVFPNSLDVFLPKDIDTTGSVLLCRGCFQRYEKLQKLTRDINYLRQEIQTNIEKSGISLGLQKPIPVVTTPYKSSADADTRATPKKRRTINTPERRALSSSVATTSPIVSVSYYLAIASYT